MLQQSAHFCENYQALTHAALKWPGVAAALSVNPLTLDFSRTKLCLTGCPLIRSAGFLCLGARSFPTFRSGDPEGKDRNPEPRPVNLLRISKKLDAVATILVR